MTQLTHVAFIPGARVPLKMDHNGPSADTLGAIRGLKIPLYITKN